MTTRYDDKQKLRDHCARFAMKLRDVIAQEIKNGRAEHDAVLAGLEHRNTLPCGEWFEAAWRHVLFSPNGDISGEERDMGKTDEIWNRTVRAQFVAMMTMF